MPVHIDGYTVLVHAHRSVVLTSLPVPEPHFAIRVTRGKELTIRTELQPASIAGAHMSGEALLAIKFEIAMLHIVDHDAVVHTLACEILSIGMHRGRRNSVHVGL